MNTKIIMASSSVALGAVGVLLTFMPAETLGALNIASAPTFVLILQLLGGLYFGFAMLNWMSQWSLIGGIYNKPVAVANFSQFFIGGMALIKHLLANASAPNVLWVPAVVYGVYALIFGWLFYSGKAVKVEQN